MPPLLLILDRFDDPITPLLNQWTYQAMIHELLGIRNNIVELPGHPGGKGGKGAVDPQQIVFSIENDDFYRDNLFTDYGQLHDRLMHALDSFKKSNPAFQVAEEARGGAPVFQSIAEMQKFVERYPEMNKIKDNVAKHVNILHALSRRIETDHVMEASELEQQLACVQDHKAALKQVRALLAEESGLPDLAKLRLILLFALRYEREAVERGELAALLHLLPATLRPDTPHLPHAHSIPAALLRACGRAARTPGSDLFNRGVSATVRNGLSGLRSLSAAALPGVGGGGVGGATSEPQDNAYMLHEPLLARLLRELERGRLPEDAYPYKECGSGGIPAPANRPPGAAPPPTLAETLRGLRRGPAEVVVFIVGGATYAEARSVARWNEANRHLRVLLGGTCFLSSTAFIQSVLARASRPAGGGGMGGEGAED
jgi:vacuolar protein sorting-associated protein 45